MKRKNKKVKKKNQKKDLRKKKGLKTKSRQNRQLKSIDLQKVIGFKFQTLSKAYENFKKRREIEKSKQNKLKVRKEKHKLKGSKKD